MYEVETLAEFGNRMNIVEDLERQVSLLTEQNKKLVADRNNWKNRHQLLVKQIIKNDKEERVHKAVQLLKAKELRKQVIADKFSFKLRFIQRLSELVSRGVYG